MNTTYSLSLIVNFLNEKNMLYTFHSYKSENENYLENGVLVKIDDSISISIQTHPLIADTKFAEIAVMDMITNTFICDMKAFHTPEELFNYLCMIPSVEQQVSTVKYVPQITSVKNILLSPSAQWWNPYVKY